MPNQHFGKCCGTWHSTKLRSAQAHPTNATSSAFRGAVFLAAEMSPVPPQPAQLPCAPTHSGSQDTNTTAFSHLVQKKLALPSYLLTHRSDRPAHVTTA